jgi:transposase
MWYCGIDVSSKKSYVVVSDEKGALALSAEVDTTKVGFHTALERYAKKKLKIVIEAGGETLWIYDCLKELGAEVVVVNPRNVKLIAESRRKTDKIDAKILCELLRINGLPRPVHVPSMTARAMRGLLKARRQAVRCRASLCNTARGILRQEGVKLAPRKLATQKGWKEIIAWQYKHAHIAPVLKAFFDSFMALTRTIQELDRELKTYAEKDARIELLKTMPSVGPVAALTLVAAIDKVERFASSRALVNYSGLAPSLRQSGERANYGPINRMGRTEIRGVWVQIAHLVAHSDKSAAKPLQRWFMRVARRRGKKTALVALTRKILTMAFSMLRTGTVYDPKMLTPKKKVA